MDTKIWGIIGGVALVLALLSPLVLGNTKKVKGLFDDAEGCYERSEYADALEKYNKTLKESKKYGVKTEIIDTDFAARVSYRIGRCLKQLDRNNEALEYYRFIIVEFPQSQYTTHSYIDSGDIYYDREDYEAASEEYKRALETTADEEWKSRIYQKYQQTLVHIESQNSARSTEDDAPIPEPSAAEEIDRPNFAALIEATSLRFENRFEESAARYEAFANNYLPFEDGVYALYWTGRCYYKASLFQQSVDAFERLVNEYGYIPNAIEAYHGLAEAYYTWGEREEDRSKYQLAIRTVERAEGLYASTDDTPTWLERMRGIKQQAIERLDNIPPDSPSPVDLVQQGYEHYRRGELEAARRKAEQALERDPNYLPARELLSKITEEKHYIQGLRFLDENRSNAAIIEFKQVISINPNSKEAYFNLGVAYFNLHNYAYAKNAVYDALKIDPEYEEALRLLRKITENQD